tara:strand:- start:704 stop:1270 length:567 start_codon:yes stop_codon:yes gene_type:complete
MRITNLFGKNKKKAFNILVILGVIALVAFFLKYNNDKNVSNLGMRNLSPMELNADIETSGGVKAAAKNSGVVGASSQESNDYLNVSGLESNKPKVGSCNNEPVMNPKELLPSDSEWSNIVPSKGLEKVSFLTAGHNFGTNTVGSSLRNANLQVRSEPVIQKVNTGPWNESTIDADTTRKALEIGGMLE